MKKQHFFAYVFSVAVFSTLIGCGQDNEIDQSVPDPVIEVAETTATTTVSSGSTSTTTASAVSGSESGTESTTSTTSGTTTTTTMHYAGNPNLTVRNTTTIAPVVTNPIAVETTAAAITTLSGISETTFSATETSTETTVTTVLETALTTGTLVAPNGMFAEDDLRFTFEDLSIKPGDDGTDFRNSMLGKGYLSREELDGETPIVAYDDLGLTLSLAEDGVTIQKITISGSQISTEKGIRIGSTPDEVRSAYGSSYEPVNGGAIYQFSVDSNMDGQADYQMQLAFDENSLVKEITYYYVTQ